MSNNKDHRPENSSALLAIRIIITLRLLVERIVIKAKAKTLKNHLNQFLKIMLNLFLQLKNDKIYIIFKKINFYNVFLI